MMPNIRILPPPNGPFTLALPGGRSISTTANTPIDVEASDAYVAGANGWIICAPHGVGTTAQRPANPTKNMRYTDTTLGVVVMFDGKNWIHEVTGGAV